MTKAGTVIGHYTCSLLSPTTFIPSACQYFGTDSTLLGQAPCSVAAAVVGCDITTCFSISVFIECPATENPLHVRVVIDQQCNLNGTALVAINTPLTCAYGKATANKTKKVTIVCQGGSNIDCTITDNYNTVIRKLCRPFTDGSTTETICDIREGAETTGTILWTLKCQAPASLGLLPHCDIRDAQATPNKLGGVDCTQAFSCTITDLNSNTITLNCPSAGGGNYYCSTIDKPECPGTAGPTAITASTIACSASLIVSLVASQSGIVTLVYPLSQAELQFVLEKLGAGSQVWKESGQPNNLPPVTEL